MRHIATPCGSLSAILVAGLMLARVAWAMEPPPGAGKNVWLRVTTPNFALYGEVPEARLRAVAARLETYRAALEWLHPGSRTSPRETRIYVFKDAKSGLPFTPAPVAGGALLDVAQEYDVPNYVTVAAPTDDPPLDVLYRSYALQFLDDNFPRLPLTVRVGLAEFYTGFAVTPEGTLIGQVNADHVRWLRENAALPLAQQLTLDGTWPPLATPEGRKRFVAGSWALMHFLVAGSGEKRRHLPEFLLALERGVSPADAAAPALDLTLDELQNEVARYVRGDRFPVIRVGSDASSELPDVGSIVTHPMGRDEVLAGLGDILGHAGADRLEDAEAYLREALRLNRGQARAYAGLGYLRYSRGRYDEAAPLLQIAVDIDPDAMSCYLLARSLLKLNAGAGASVAGQAAGARTDPATPAAGTPAWLARVRELLARAMALRPRFAAPYVTLGATHTLPDGDVAAGIALLEKARTMLPARTDIPGNLVYLFLRQGDLARAQKMEDDALVHGGDPAALAKARAAIATYQQNVAAARQRENPRPPTPEEEARWKAIQEAEVKNLRDELARTTDPARKAQIERALKEFDVLPSVLPYNDAVAIFNKAVDRANHRDYPGAISLLEELLPQVDDPELKEQITTLLERLRKDAARPVQ